MNNHKIYFVAKKKKKERDRERKRARPPRGRVETARMALDGTTEKVKLLSSDGVEFSINEDAALLSETLKNNLEGVCAPAREGTGRKGRKRLAGRGARVI